MEDREKTLAGIESGAEEALVVAHHELAVDLFHGLEGDADDDEDRDAAEGESGDVGHGDDQQREHRDGGQEERPWKGEAVEDFGQVPLGGRTGADAGDETALLAD